MLGAKAIGERKKVRWGRAPQAFVERKEWQEMITCQVKYRSVLQAHTFNKAHGK